MEIKAVLVKELRQRTGVGMMECKKALVENSGDLEKALVWLRERGMSRAAKKSARAAAEGVVEIAHTADQSKAVMLELNCETDFAGKNEDFRSFATEAAKLALAENISDVDALAAAKMGESTVAESLVQLIAKVGENMKLRRLTMIEAPAEGVVSSYVHMGGRIGSVVVLQGPNKDALQTIGADVAMHIAACAPRYCKKDEVDTSELEQEKEIARNKLREQGKPEDMIEKIVMGQMNKFYTEVCLLDQPFVKEPKQSVSKYVAAESAGSEVVKFARFQLGEGVEVQKQNFNEEVMAQLKDS